MADTLTILAAAEYPLHRDLAMRLKKGDKNAAAQAADILLRLLPEGPLTLVPVPSHTGRPTYMLHVAQILAQRRGTDSTAVFPYLRTRPHASRHNAKCRGADPGRSLRRRRSCRETDVCCACGSEPDAPP